MAIQGKQQEHQTIDKLYYKLYEQYDELNKLNKSWGGQQQEQIAGNVKVYTGPKNGKFIINKHGKKIYIDRVSLQTNFPYVKKKRGK